MEVEGLQSNDRGDGCGGGDVVEAIYKGCKSGSDDGVVVV